MIDFVPPGFYQDFSITELMRDVRQCGAVNPKDKIFGLQGVLRRIGFDLPQVDYNRSLNEIYYTTTLLFLKIIPQDAAAIQLVALVTGRQRSQSDSDPHPLPSWVPDYSDQLPPYSVFDHNGNVHQDNMKSNFHFSHDNFRICTPAVVVDCVKKASKLTLWHPDRILMAGDDIVHETLKKPEYVQQTVLALQEWIRLISHLPDTYDATKQSKQEAFFATIGAHRGETNIHMQVNRIAKLRQKHPSAMQLRQLCEDLIRSRSFEPQSLKAVLMHLYKHTFESDAKIWWSILMATDPAYTGLDRETLLVLLAPLSRPGYTYDLAALKSESDELLILLTLDTVLPGLCESIITACRGNTFFCTESGYVGAGTSTISDGDLVVYIGGLNCPMAVRRCNDGYRLLGPLHVHGTMKGELWPSVREIYRSKTTVGDSSAGRAQIFYCDLELI